MNDARLSGLYRLGVPERIARLEELGYLSAVHAMRLRDGRHVLSAASADQMIENVLGVFGLPFAIAPNFIVNGREHVVPLVVEEPSIVAGLSAAASMARPTGGFTVENDNSLLIGQVHITGLVDADHAIAAVSNASAELVDLGNAVHPRLVERGGGVRDIEVRLFALPDGQPLVAVHVLVDTCDAMGANLVNSICEAIAPKVAALCNGHVALRILSNLADRSLFTARVRYALPENERDAIVEANDIALVDPYRAATHNKGIMNGVDALAIATGNDWRAIEASAHAFAAATGRYQALTRWSVDADGQLVGEIKLPLKVGTVGGTLANNPAAALGIALCGVVGAGQLAELMAAVGLAQNFAALRALTTHGIQAGHMKLHARSVAASAGAPAEVFDSVVERLIESGEIKDWKAREIVAALRTDEVAAGTKAATAAGKVILLGEHGVVYGGSALALPVPNAVSVSLVDADELTHDLPEEFVACLLGELGVEDARVRIILTSRLPFGKGLGSSAAIAVAIARAFNERDCLGLDDEGINAVAFASEKLAHGTPSGIDNTVATFAQAMLFSKGDGLQVEPLLIDRMPPLLIAWGDETGRTSDMVAGVRARSDQSPEQFAAIFDQMDALSRRGAEQLRAGAWHDLGAAMNVCHGLLNAIGVSTPGLEHMVALARQHGAAGAKLTGAGGGGSIVAVCPDGTDKVEEVMREAGYRTLVLVDEGSS